MRFELSCCTEVLLGEIANTRFTKHNVADTYALALRSPNPTDWDKIHKPIIDRWGGLKDIKQYAWFKKPFEEEPGAWDIDIREMKTVFRMKQPIYKQFL